MTFAQFFERNLTCRDNGMFVLNELEMVDISEKKEGLVELRMEIIWWGLFLGFGVLFSEDERGSMEWREFMKDCGVCVCL